MKPRFYLMVGVQGSGKTTYAQKYLPQALRVCLDDLRLMLTGVAFEPRYEPIVMVVAEAILHALLPRAHQWQRDVLLDATNVTAERRRPYVRLARQYDLEPIAVYLACDLATALKRNGSRPNPVPQEAIHRFYEQLEPPTKAEGFAQVLEIEDFSL